MTRRVWLHIGLPKTGTTYLQDALWANQEALRARGLLLPGRHRRRHLLASLDVREDPGLAKRPGDVAHPWQDLVDEIGSPEADGRDAVISHEFFASASPAQIERVVASFPGAEVHVVLTARSMVDLGISRWQEWVKNGGRQDIDSYPVERPYNPADSWGWASFDLADVLDRWGSVLPHARIHVLPVASRGSDPQDLWVRFLGVLGLDVGELEAPEQAANTSLGVVEVELLRRVNGELTGFGSARDRGQWIRGYLGEGGVLPSSGERFRPSEAKQQELRERGERAVRMLRAGGYDVVGELAALDPPDLTGRRHPSEVTDSELLAAAVSAIATMTSDVRARTRERDEARARLADEADADPAGVTMTRVLTKLGSRAHRPRRGKKSS